MCELRQLSAALAKKAANELNESPENIAHKLKAMREWVKAHPHIRARTNDQFLIAFLRGSKYSLERAKKKIENFYVYKKKIPEVFLNRDPRNPKVYEILKLGCLSYLHEPVAPDGPRVVMIRPNRFDLTKHTIPEVFMVGSMATDILLLEDDNAIIAGYIIIMDLKNIPKDVIFSFNPVLARKLTILANKSSPTRMKGFHFLNVPSMFSKLFNAVKSVINDKLKDRMYIHNGNLETLYEHVPRRILTKEYGGELDDNDFADTWWQRFQDHADFLKDEESYGLVGDIKDLDNYKNEFNDAEYGVEGSFRKLNFD